MSHRFPDPFGPLTEMWHPQHPMTLAEYRAHWRRQQRLRRLALALVLTAVLIASALMLSACGTTPGPRSEPLRPPLALTAPCQPPPPLESGSASALLENHIEAMRRYAQCSARLKQLTRWIESQNLASDRR